jgi:hypothetical protein
MTSWAKKAVSGAPSVLRAALRLRAHYLDLSAHMVRHPFKAEQLAYSKRFAEKRRLAIINAGVAPGLTNLLAARAADMLDHVDTIHIRLYESTDGDAPLSQWSAEGIFDQMVSHPRVVRDGRFHLTKRFAERELFRFPPPIGEVSVVLAAQDEVGTLPHNIKLKEMDVKIGGNEIDRLRRWQQQGKLQRSRGLVRARFPRTDTPGQVARLVRRGRLHNARFAAAVIVSGTRKDKPLELRWDVTFPTLYQIRMLGLGVTPVTYGTAQMAALFVRYFPRNLHGVFPPEALSREIRQQVLNGARARGFRITMKSRQGKEPLDEQW